MPFEIRLPEFTKNNRPHARYGRFFFLNVVLVYFLSFSVSVPDLLPVILFSSYEPELHPAVCYRIKTLRATLQIFSTGSITVTGILMS